MRESKQEIASNHKAVDLFRIVLDIEKYPQYIPWCSDIEILSKKNNEIKANMIVDYKFFYSQKDKDNFLKIHKLPTQAFHFHRGISKKF